MSGIDNVCTYFLDRFVDMRVDNRNDWLTVEALKERAIEDGLLHSYCERTGERVLETDIVREARERSEAAKQKSSEQVVSAALAMQADFLATKRPLPPVRLRKGVSPEASEGTEGGGGKARGAPPPLASSGAYHTPS